MAADSAVLAVRRPAAKHPYMFQFVLGYSLVELRFPPTKVGVFEIPLENQTTVAAATALRLWNARPAFQGVLRFEGARVERV